MVPGQPADLAPWRVQVWQPGTMDWSRLLPTGCRTGPSPTRCSPLSPTGRRSCLPSAPASASEPDETAGVALGADAGPFINRSSVAFTSLASRLVTRNSVTSPRRDPNMIPVLQLAGDRGQPVGGHRAVLLGPGLHWGGGGSLLQACHLLLQGLLIQRGCAHDPLIPPRTPAGQGTRQSAPWPSQDPPFGTGAAERGHRHD
jgi:hypothetical protein